MQPEEAIATAITVGFERAEGFFYLVLFVSASAGTFVRACRDNRRYSSRSLFGRCAAGGLIGCGIVACWIGATGHITASGYVYAFASALIGFFNEEIQNQAVSPMIDMILDKVERLLGGGKRNSDKQDDGPKEQV